MIVVTGGAGFIGSVIVWKLNQLGRKDLVVVDQHAKGSAKWKNIEKRTFDAYYESSEFLERLEKGEFDGKVDAVFHMGACSDTTEMDKKFLRENNSRYSERVAQWCLKHGAYLNYASSAATYGDGELGFDDCDALTSSLKPLNPYGQSKLDFDMWVLKHGYEKKFAGFRFFNVYGPNEYHKGAMRSMVHKGFEQIRDTGKLKLFKSYKPEFPDGGQKRDFVYVKDVVDAMIWFWQNPAKTGITNLGAGNAESWNDLAAAIFRAMGKPVNIEYVEMPDSIKNQYQYYTKADQKKLDESRCPVPFRDVAHGVEDYVKNHLLTSDPYL